MQKLKKRLQGKLQYQRLHHLLVSEEENGDPEAKVNCYGSEGG